MKPESRSRIDIADADKWDLTRIFATWDEWQDAYVRLESLVLAFEARRGSLGDGADALRAAFEATDELGQLAYRVWYYPALRHDEDQRDNDVNARRQQVQILMARWQQATSWFNPELLALPFDRVRAWMDASPALARYRFAIENLYRQQEHVLDEKGERLLSLVGRFDGTASEAYSALSTADVKFPSVTLGDGRTVTASYDQFRAILEQERDQADREAVFRAYLGTFDAARNTCAALYNGVCQRDWAAAQARSFASTLEAALHGNNIPVAVVETLVDVTRAQTGGLRRYHRLRRRALGLARYCSYDTQVPIVDVGRTYSYDEARAWVAASVAPLGPAYQAAVVRSFESRSIDVYHNEGKRSGAYSAPVYGVHPYMLLNYNDTLDSVFTLAHEMGHNVHTVLAHAHQPFVYSDYTIFVAEVPSTLAEALLLEHLLGRTEAPRERIRLLEHAIESIAGTFFSQVLFADFECRAHRLAETDRPITADILCDLWGQLLSEYFGDVFDDEPLARLTWARVPHFFASPYYVYQYATCFASAACLADDILQGTPASRAAAVDRYLALLKAGASDDPMELLRRAGVDLREPDAVRAVITRFDALVSRLETELATLDGRP